VKKHSVTQVIEGESHWSVLKWLWSIVEDGFHHTVLW